MRYAHVRLQVRHRDDSVLIYCRPGDVYLHIVKIRKADAVPAFLVICESAIKLRCRGTCTLQLREVQQSRRNDGLRYESRGSGPKRMG